MISFKVELKLLNGNQMCDTWIEVLTWVKQCHHCLTEGAIKKKKTKYEYYNDPYLETLCLF